MTQPEAVPAVQDGPSKGGGLASFAPKGVIAFLAFFFYALWIHFNFISTGAISLDGSSASSLGYSTSVLVNGLALILLAVFHRRYERHLFDSGAVVTALFLCTLGTFISVTTGLFIAWNPLIEFAAGCMTGVGSAILFLMLVILIVQEKRYIPCMMFAFLLATVAAVPMRFLPPFVLLIITLLMPMASIVCIFQAKKSNEVPNTEGPVREQIKPMMPLVIRASVFILAVYFCITISSSFARMNHVQPDAAALLIATVIVLIGLFASFTGEGRKLNVVSLYRIVFLCALAGVLSIPFFTGQYSVSYGVIAVLTPLCRAFIIVIAYRICVKSGISPVIVFAVAETIKKIPNMISPFLPISMVFSDPQMTTRAFLVLALVLAVVYLLVFTEKNLLQLSKDDHILGTAERIEEQRIRMAERAELTEREVEIFLLLCEGRNAPWISRELFISQSTVNVHVKNIYRKFDVHSRQELLDMADVDA